MSVDDSCSNECSTCRLQAKLEELGVDVVPLLEAVDPEESDLT